MKEYTLTLTEDDANTILHALSLRPYIEVAELIGKIHMQAAEKQSV